MKKSKKEVLEIRTKKRERKARKVLGLSNDYPKKEESFPKNCVTITTVKQFRQLRKGQIISLFFEDESPIKDGDYTITHVYYHERSSVYESSLGLQTQHGEFTLYVGNFLIKEGDRDLIKKILTIKQ